MAIRIGTSGWSYDHWEGILYPPGMPAIDRFTVYARHYGTVEVNSTFYRWPPVSTFSGWRRRAPDGFLFAIKAPRGLTHGARLFRPERWLDRIEAGMDALHDRRGPLLVQLPPAMEYDYPRLKYFLDSALPSMKVAVEFRHPSWIRDDVMDLLERHAAAYCIMSGAGLPCRLHATAPFVYARLHGPDPHHLYAGSYPDRDLGWWADRLREWDAAGRDVFIYFNNDGEGNAVRNSEDLKRLLDP